MREVVSPVVIETPEDRMHDRVTTHPAFAQIRANRGSGRSNLYGSDFSAGSSVAIEICASVLYGSIAREHPFERESYIRVELSEAQWATFVSTLNNGSGTQCTLRSVRDADGSLRYVPGLPDPPDVSGRFAEGLNTVLLDAQKALQKLALDPRLPGWARKEIGIQAGFITANSGYVAEQFAEHVEKTVGAAKIEIHAYAQGTLQRAGIEAIAGGYAPALPGPKAGE